MSSSSITYPSKDLNKLHYYVQYLSDNLYGWWIIIRKQKMQDSIIWLQKASQDHQWLKPTNVQDIRLVCPTSKLLQGNFFLFFQVWKAWNLVKILKPGIFIRVIPKLNGGVHGPEVY